jgi:hypothetical protein
MRLRERQPEKELSGNFRFKHANQIDRIFQTLSQDNYSGKSAKFLIEEGLRT